MSGAIACIPCMVWVPGWILYEVGVCTRRGGRGRRWIDGWTDGHERARSRPNRKAATNRKMEIVGEPGTETRRF